MATPKDKAEGKDTLGTVIKGLDAGTFATLKKIPAGGALQVRKLPDGSARFYWRYTAHGKTDRVAIGIYDPKAPPKSLKPTDRGFSILAAEERCKELATVQAENRDTGGIRAVQAADRAAHLAKQQAEADRSRHTLRALLLAYCDHLESIGRRSHREARSLFKLHVFQPEELQAIVNAPAASVTGEQVADILRRVHTLGKKRTANVLRSYIHAAYQVARAAKTDPKLPIAFKAYGVTYNPAAETARDGDADQPDKNPLSIEEMRAYWQAIKALPGTAGAVLRLHLLTGGQRVQQLTRLKRDGVKDDRITLFDLKGKPGKPPRQHDIPLLPAAAVALAELPPGSGEFAISSDGGKTPVNALTVTRWAQAAPHGIEGFQLKRVRSGVETLLSKNHVSRDIRGELQSHGLSGVQKRHYDGNDFLPEKLKALETLIRVLEEQPGAKVVPIRAA